MPCAGCKERERKMKETSGSVSGFPFLIIFFAPWVFGWIWILKTLVEAIR